MRKCILALFSLLLLAPSLLHAACNPQFSWTQAPAGNNLLRVSFTNTTATTFPPGTVPHFTLYFGDNTSQSNFSSTTYHSYAAPGTYNAMLRIELHDSINPANTCIDTVFHQVTVSYSACASTVSTVANGNGSYTFTANTPAGTSGMAYTWNFGDGTTGSGNPVTHSYAASGNYTVTLHATGGGCTYNNEQHVQYSNNICDSLHANFGHSLTGPATISFSNTSTALPGVPLISSYWSFGDGGTSSQYSPVHTYPAPGMYQVTLVSTWADSLTFFCRDSAIHWVTVSGGSLPCDSLHASFSTSISGQSVSFSNTSGSFGNMYISNSAWYFGDGSSTANNNSPSHYYAAPGTYTVTLVTSWTDSFTMTHCQDTFIHPVTVFAPGNICDTLHANFNSSVSGYNVSFSNTSTALPGVPLSSTYWSFGDGATSTQYSPTHTYTAPGTYQVSLVSTWADSITFYCRDSVIHSVIISGNPANNEISGNVYFDSLMVTNPTDSFKIWLIRHDTAANTLTAVDSVYRSIFSAHYGFHNKPAGQYLVKAAVLGQTTGSFGWIPTYHYSSPYWGGATPIVHNGGATLHKDILMLTGTVPSGPGFVGGNISSGAGRGTNTGISNVLVLLRNSSTSSVIATYTNNDGDYAFNNIPEGTYDVYPEAMNYRTTPSAAIIISGGSSSSGNNNFQQTEDEIIPMKVLGISKLTREDGITVYPNPVAQTLFLECKNNRYTQLTVINVLGQVVKQQTLHTGNNSIDMAHMSAGAYYLILKGNDDTRSLQISKK